MDKQKSANVLFYMSLIGFIVTFFSFFSPVSYTSSYSRYSVSTKSASLLDLCLNGTIAGGGFIYVMVILLLVFALVVDIIVTVKLTKGDDVPKGIYVAFIPFGAITIILAIVLLSIFVTFFNGQAVSVRGSYDTATAYTGGELWYMYISFFEAGATAIIAGIVGVAGYKEMAYYRYRARYYAINKGQQLFKEGDYVELTYDNVSPYIASGTKCVITSMVTSSFVYINLVDHPLERPISVSTDRLIKYHGDVVPSSPVAEEEDDEEEVEVKETKQVSETKEVANNNTLSNFEKVKEYKKLLDEGYITEEEYEKKRKELLEL